MAHYIETPCGPIQGIASEKAESVSVYRGIRYATAKRFCRPVQTTHWDGVYDATKFGNCCYQPRAFYDEATSSGKAFYYREFREGETYTYSEDCLFLNIWTPAEARDLPVIFYIHGGSLLGGCGFEKHFEGEAFCKRDVIFVSINYRLGPLGFLAHPWLDEEAGTSGNYGAYDQLCALQWVYDNIAAFGGDPNRITIMGQSAGAMSVQALVLSPLTEGLICGAIMLSGGGVNSIINPGAKRYKDIEDFWGNVVTAYGVSNLEELRQLDPQTIFEIYDKVKQKEKGSMTACSPCGDGTFLVDSGKEIVAQGRAKFIPYITCTTSEDVVPPVFFSMAKGWVNKQAAIGNPNCYQAFFCRRLPGDDNGAWHSSDLWYALGTLKNGWRPFTPEDFSLSDAMVSYYSNFAKTGNPNGPGLPKWVAAGKGNNETVIFDVPKIGMGRVSMKKLLKTMLKNQSVGE